METWAKTRGVRRRRCASASPLLSAAILRISATLDLDTVLAEVVESARGLTGARCGVIATVDETGAPRDFVFSGVSPDEEREFLAWPDGARLFDHLRGLPGPLRLADLSGYVRSLGMTPARVFSRTFQATPMSHRGTGVGHFFLAEKADGGEFTDDDEEVLTLFASQAAAAVASARAHRAERRARADLEALVETSPVGVAVFDAESRRPATVLCDAGLRDVAALSIPEFRMRDMPVTPPDTVRPARAGTAGGAPPRLQSGTSAMRTGSRSAAAGCGDLLIRPRRLPHHPPVPRSRRTLPGLRGDAAGARPAAAGGGGGLGVGRCPSADQDHPFAAFVR